MQLMNAEYKSSIEELDRDTPLTVKFDDVTGLTFENYLKLIDSGSIQGIGRSDV